MDRVERLQAELARLDRELVQAMAQAGAPEELLVTELEQQVAARQALLVRAQALARRAAH